MLNFIKFFMILLLLVIPGCASQPVAENSPSNKAETGADVAANSESGDDPDEMICRREQVTGTNFRRRVCMTRADREREQADSQEEMLERRSAIR